MSFLYARHTRLPPLFFEAPFTDEGLTDGISSGAGHLDTRTACVKKFIQAFGEDALVSTAIKMHRVEVPLPLNEGAGI